MTADAVLVALAAGSLVRVWTVRGTWHLVTPDDARWMPAVLGPDFRAAMVKRHGDLGLTDELVTRASAAAMAALVAAPAPVSRDALFASLAAEGIGLAGQQRPHLLWLMAYAGLVVAGQRNHTFQPAARVVPRLPALDPASAATRLARRYLAAFGPASRADFAAWSGLRAATVDAGWTGVAPETIDLVAESGPARLLAGQAAMLDAPPPVPAWALLAPWDTYLMGYAARRLTVDAADLPRFTSANGMIPGAVLRRGRAVALWSLRQLPTPWVGIRLLSAAGSLAIDDIAPCFASLHHHLGLASPVPLRPWP